MGPVLDGVLFRSLASPEDADGDDPASQRDIAPDGAPTQDLPTLDGVPLAALGTTEVDASPHLSMAVVWALHHTPEPPNPADHQRLLAYEEIRSAFTPRRPMAVVLG